MAKVLLHRSGQDFFAFMNTTTKTTAEKTNSSQQIKFIKRPDGGADVVIPKALESTIEAIAEFHGITQQEAFEMALRNQMAEDEAGHDLSIAIPPSIQRLAKQLGKDSKALAEDILRAGIVALDDGLATHPLCEIKPLLFVATVAGYSNDYEFTITGLIENMKSETLDDCLKEAENCSQTLQEIVRERAQRGSDLRKMPENQYQFTSDETGESIA